MSTLSIIICLTSLSLVSSQRPFYAGLQPIGYPEVANVGSIQNRFDADDGPIQTRGDNWYNNRLANLPINNQPFWFINWKQYENERNNPKFWPQRPNGFINRF